MPQLRRPRARRGGASARAPSPGRHPRRALRRARVAQRQSLVARQDDCHLHQPISGHQRQRHPRPSRFPAQRDSAAARPRTGLVTCLYAGIPAPGLWSHLEALGMSVELPSGVLIADMLEGMRFALGAAIAVRRDALEKIGGIASTSHYYSDDFVLGNRVHAAGYRVLLSHVSRRPRPLRPVVRAKPLPPSCAGCRARATRARADTSAPDSPSPFPSACSASSPPPRSAIPPSALRCWLGACSTASLQSAAIGYARHRRPPRPDACAGSTRCAICWDSSSGWPAIAEAATSAGAANSTASPPAAASSPSSAPPTRSRSENFAARAARCVARRMVLRASSWAKRTTPAANAA